MPKQAAGGAGVGIRIEGINSVVLRGDKQHVASARGWDIQTGNIKRLRINVAIHVIGKEFAESAGLDVGGGKKTFIQILSGSGIVIVISQDIDLRAEWQRAKQAGNYANKQPVFRMNHSPLF